MGVNTMIEWAHHTFNPWRGCTKVSPGCANCYAETLSRRNPGTLGVWGPNGTRVVASESMWTEPLKWDRAAAKAGERHRVFCASLADVFEDWQGPMVNSHGDELFDDRAGGWSAVGGDKDGHRRFITMSDVRRRLFQIDATRNLDWLLLTKRPENAASMMASVADPRGLDHHRISKIMGSEVQCPALPPNVWIGTSVEDQAAKARIDILRDIPAVVRFLSVEPLLEDLGRLCLDGIHWVIVGGESGPGARPMHPDWVRSIRDQCAAANVPFFFKQWGDMVSCWNDDVPEAVIQKIDGRINLAGYDGPEWFRVGKRAAGRLLDGRTHDEVPTSRTDLT